jgi:hypothetical protein
MHSEVRLHSREVVISRRFRGPPDSANGGYACGVIGCSVHGVARVRLNVPPPLDTTMTIQQHDPDTAELMLRDALVGKAERVDDEWRVPGPVEYDDAVGASASFPWYEGHPFPSCFVCGPDRMGGDGLRIFAGALLERRIVAAPWTPAESVCDASGLVQPEVVWAALDCPSWFGILEFEARVRYALLGELTARIIDRPRQDSRCVIIGWASGRDGRKLSGGTAIYDEAGALLATSAATWVELKDAPFATSRVD